MLFSLLSGLLAASFFASTQAIPTISAKGSKFFKSDGSQWFIKGIAYQLSEDDPLLNTNQCKLDASLMSKLGANTIRVYHVNDGDHSGCMSTFASYGIYLFVDLDTFTTQIEEDSPMWTQRQASAFEAVMDEFQQYDNTAGFFVGNEVLTLSNHSEAAPFVKAAARDMKAYRDSKGYRKIPIGYSHADISTLRPNLQNYLACGTNSSESIDFFGLNAYEWCGSNTYEGSGYSTLTSEVMQYPVPIFISETGCIKPEPRLFQDQDAIFGPEMTPYWSGAIIYEWIQEENHYGLITYGKNTNALVTDTSPPVRSGTPTPISPDFTNLMNKWKTNNPTGTSEDGYSPSLTPPTCPSLTPGAWEVHGQVVLPTLGATYDSAVQYSITAGHASGMAATSTMAASPSSTTGAASRTTAASGTKELLGMFVALSCVMLGFVLWL